MGGDGEAAGRHTYVGQLGRARSLGGLPGAPRPAVGGPVTPWNMSECLLRIMPCSRPRGCNREQNRNEKKPDLGPRCVAMGSGERD